MEDSKLVALYDSLKGGFRGKQVGLGAGGKVRVAAAGPPLPKNELYQRFVRAGAYDPADEGVGHDYAGKKLKLGGVGVSR